MRPVAVLRLAIASVFLATLAPTWADPDLWGHLRFGADILSSGIPERDPYSYTGGPVWVNQSWLADFLMALAYGAGGTPLLVAGKLLVAVAIVAIVAWVLHRDGVRGSRLELLVLLCIAALYPSIPTVRPQLLSLLAFALLLERATSRRTAAVRALVVAPLIMAAWANLHGAWLIGLVCFEAWLAVEIVSSRLGTPQRAALAGIGMASVLATLATPYGIGLWTELVSTMGGGLRDVAEWRGLLETGSPALVVWLVLLGVGLYAAATVGVRASRLVVLAILAFASWRVRRLLPFFGVADVTLLASSLVAARARRPAPARAARPLASTVRAALLAAAVVVIGFDLWRVGRAFSCVRIDHTREADVQAARFLRANGLRGRLLVYSDWGLYAIWHLAPALRVSIDGRREFAYPLAELARHDAIYAGAPDALDDVAALAPDYVWLPATLPIVPRLAHAGWSTVYRTDRSAILARPREAPYVLPNEAPLPMCFPADP